MAGALTQPEVAKARWTVRVVAPLLRAVLWPLRPWLRGTLAARFGRASALESAGKHREAFELALESAALCGRRRAHLPFVRAGGQADFNLFRWWRFAAIAARAARSLSSRDRQRLLELTAAPPGRGGQAEAEVLSELARWRWNDKDVDGALALSQRAIEADASWPHGHIHRAFYGKHSGRHDPLPPLLEALRADPACLPQIESTFRDSPGLLAELRKALQR